MNRGSVLGYILYVCCQFIIVWISYIRITEVRVSSEGEDKGDGVHYHSWLYNRSTDPPIHALCDLADSGTIFLFTETAATSTLNRYCINVFHTRFMIIYRCTFLSIF